MFVMKVDKNIATISSSEPMTHGSVNVYLIEFQFSEEWDDLDKVAVFKTGDTVVDILLDDTNMCMMPWEVLTNYGRTVKFGVYGMKDSNIVLPTTWAATDVILEGVITGASAQPPSPTLYEQLLDRMRVLEHLEELRSLVPLTLLDLEALLV